MLSRKYYSKDDPSPPHAKRVWNKCNMSLSSTLLGVHKYIIAQKLVNLLTGMYTLVGRQLCQIIVSLVNTGLCQKEVFYKKKKKNLLHRKQSFFKCKTPFLKELNEQFSKQRVKNLCTSSLCPCHHPASSPPL